MEIEKIYIINTGESTEAVQANLVSKLNQCSFVEETGFEIININQFHNGMPDGYAMGPVEMTQAEIDEAITNRLIWEKIIFDGKDRVLILRDDFLCTTNMADYSLPDDSVRWDIAILNRNDLTDNTLINIDDNWVRPQTFNTTSTAYMLNKSTTASLLLSGGLKTNVVPIDQYLSAISYPYIANTAVQDIFKPGLESIGTKNPKMITRTDEVVSQIPAPIKIDASTQEYFEILDDSDWDAWKLKYLNLSVAKGEWDLMVDDLGDNIYELPLFTPKFCKEAIALAEAKDEWTEDRHEFYPTNDVLLPELGLNDIYNKVLDEVIRPLSKHLWHLEGSSWDAFSNENFMARYTTTRQSHLSLHHDRSHLTLVIKLNDEFSGGGTWFPKYQKLINPEVVGTASLHPGMVTHRHGARPITMGKRYIIVSFIRTGDNP